MTRRYFVPELPPSGGPLNLPDEEAAHAARVMRASPGDGVTLFCGDGRQAEAEIVSVDRRRVFVHAQPPQEVDREHPSAITVAVSLPKADRARSLVERLTELGVARVQPIVCQRTQIAPSRSAIEKLRRAVVEASKQCGRNRLMHVADSLRLSALLAGATEDPSELRLIAHPGGAPLAEVLQVPTGTPAAGNKPPIQIAIGPEGGFADDEVEQATTAGWRPVALGPRILRIETAAAAAVARIVLG